MTSNLSSINKVNKIQDIEFTQKSNPKKLGNSTDINLLKVIIREKYPNKVPRSINDQEYTFSEDEIQKITDIYNKISDNKKQQII